MFKRVILLTAIFLLVSFYPVFAQSLPPEDGVNIYFFYGNGCPHCSQAERFLEELKEEIPEMHLYTFEIWNNMENARFAAMLGREIKIDISAVPFIIIGNKVFPGFYTAETTGAQMEEVIKDYLNNGYIDVVAQIIKKNLGIEEQDGEKQNYQGAKSKDMPEKIMLPFFGDVETKKFSLPVLTILIAAMDGFNPCAMWVLLFLISLLLGMKNKKRMWILGSAFVITSGLVYFLFLSAWLNLFLFLGFMLWVRIVIGLVALGSGGYHIRDYWVNRDGVCRVTGGEKRKKIFEKLKAVTQMQKFWLAFGGIILLAGAVNLVELLCSAGLPAVYTQVLALSNLSTWQYYAYLALYILIFMLDDLLIFVVAMSTLQMKVISSRYTRWSGLVGGIIMLIIGILLIFKPGWLMF